jgi:hypothetical protein
MNADELRRLLQQPEGQGLEFKPGIDSQEVGGLRTTGAGKKGL